MRNGISLAIVLALAPAPFCFAVDGGVLQSKSGQAPVRGLDAYPSYLRPGGQATMNLGGPEPEDVSVFEFDGSFRIMVTTEEPFRLYHDSNGDGERQADEAYEASEKIDSRRVVFRGVSASLDVPGGKVPVAVTVEVYRRGGESQYAHLSVPQTHFEGRITLDGKQFKSILFFGSITSRDGGSQNIIIDLNGDEDFDWLTDFWFPANGGFSFDGKTLVAETVFTDESAEVPIRPYSGPAARMEIRGVGFHMARVSANPDQNAGLPTGIEAYEICLVPNEGQAWELPVGSYQPSEIWLRSSSEPTLFWHARRVGWHDKHRVRIAKGDTATLELGGPLTQRLSVSSLLPSLTGMVYVEYGAFTNPKGLEFEPLRRTSNGDQDPLWRPSFEILDRNGKIIASADFEHG